MIMRQTETENRACPTRPLNLFCSATFRIASRAFLPSLRNSADSHTGLTAPMCSRTMTSVSHARRRHLALCRDSSTEQGCGKSTTSTSRTPNIRILITILHVLWGFTLGSELHASRMQDRWLAVNHQIKHMLLLAPLEG
jgi:hypothetical protein